MKKTIAIIFAAAALAAVAAKVDEPIQRNDRWTNSYLRRHGSICSKIKKNESKTYDLVMVGDSITHMWEKQGKDVAAEVFKGKKVLNCGNSGDRVEHVHWRLANGELQGYTTPLFQVLIGTNNREDSTEEIAAGITALIRTIQSTHPESKILLIPLLPRNDVDGKKVTPEIIAKVRAVNPLIKPLADGEKVIWMDFGDRYLNPDGSLNESLFVDRLHPNADGYKIWAEELKKYL